MDIVLSNKVNAHRRLCIKKDLIELSHWIDTLTAVNSEITHLKLIEKQLLKNNNIETSLIGFRRNNTLVIGTFCKYEQQLKTEFEYGKREYDLTRAKEHERKRDMYYKLIKEFTQLKQTVYHTLAKYQRL